MPASVSRMRLRMQLCVNRKLVATRWIGGWTVGVHVLGCPRLKASEGAEKSCRKRRRLRGQRRGKMRSRGRHPRSSAPTPARRVNEPKDRTITKHLRACDHWYDREEQFKNLFLQSQLYRLLVSGHRELESYRVWRGRWKSLHDHVVRFGEGVVWCSRIGPSFSYWLEQRFGIIVDRTEQLRPVVARSVLSDWLESYRIRHDNSLSRRFGNRPHRPPPSVGLSRTMVPDHAPSQVLVGRRMICTWCQRDAFVWRLHGCFQRWERSRRRGGLVQANNRPFRRG